jgi:hypothetical protein
MTLFAPGRRLFTLASFAVILVSVAHTAGHLAPNPNIETDPEYLRLIAAIDNYHAPLGFGMNPSFHDIHWSLVFTMTVSLLSIGVLGLLFAADRSIAPATLTKFAAIAAGTAAVLTGIFWAYQVPPPFVSLAVVTLLYAVSMRTTRV